VSDWRFLRGNIWLPYLSAVSSAITLSGIHPIPANTTTGCRAHSPAHLRLRLKQCLYICAVGALTLFPNMKWCRGVQQQWKWIKMLLKFMGEISTMKTSRQRNKSISRDIVIVEVKSIHFHKFH